MIPELLVSAAAATGQAGADRDSTWQFTPTAATHGFTQGPDTLPVQAAGEPSFGTADTGGGMILDGTTVELVLAERAADVRTHLPDRAFTVGAWVSIDMPRRWGGVAGCVRDDGDHEMGWVLGYDEHHFTIALSTTGADDGNGALTYLTGTPRPYQLGRWHHVVATYDGTTCQLYVDGEPCASTTAQSGDLLYDLEMPFVLGAYRDANEHHRHDGRLLEVRLVDRALDADEVRTWHAARSGLNDLAPWVDTTLEWLVQPYLTWPTTEAITVAFETTVPTNATLEYWHESGTDRRTVTSTEAAQLHHFRLTGLRANEKYFYRPAASDFRGGRLEGDVLSFRTAVTRDRSFTFVAIGDTQSQAEVVKRVSDLAYMHRPNLVVHAGDLVSTGTVKADWTGHFFPAMQPLIGRVPLMPVLGNHEQDARHYYEYMDLPEPEYYYSFMFGDAEFFMIDGNRRLAEGSEQLAWLAKALAASDATWKFAVLHQPPYTSDSNDYGDTLETTSTRGDPNVQNIISLLEKHHVDICFSGHVHDYERTFPIRDGRVTPYEDGGVVYVTTAGGGGHLEDFDPNNTWFGHKKARYHHLVYVGVHGNHLEFQAIDEHGRLFDVFDLHKTPGGRVRIGHEADHHDDHDASLEPHTCGSIRRLHALGDVYLASQPAPEDFSLLRDLGIRTVINQRHDREIAPFDEQALVTQLGMQYEHPAFGGPAELTDDVIASTRRMLRTAERPILLHCGSANRVGAIWFAYRALDGGLSVDDALAEAKVVGLRSPDYERVIRAYIDRNAPEHD